MSDHDTLLQVMEASEARRADRRRFMKVAGASTAAAAGVTLLSGCFDREGSTSNTPPSANPTPAPTFGGVADSDVLNFALQLEYLEAQFYSFAATGAGLPANLLTGTGTQGAVTGGRQVTFTDPLVAAYAREIANDERQHVAFLRNALGSVTVAQPAIDIGTSPTGAFSSAARAAGLVAAGQSFDPYASDENFLLGAYIFEDVGVTAYKGAAPLITNKTLVEASAGILAAEAYHAGLIRTVLYRKGLQAPALIDASEAISNARDSLDGPTDLDQGVRPIGNASNIVPADANAVAFSRSAGQVLNIVFLNRTSTDRGGFFPAGLNGAIRTSAAN